MIRSVAASLRTSLVLLAGGIFMVRQTNRGRAVASPQQSPASATDALQDTLVSLERRSWEAWQKREGAFFQSFLSDDHVEIGFGGVIRKAAVVAGVGSPACVVHRYSVDSFQLTRLGPTTALLSYHAAQQTECNGHPVPSPVWAGSTYVLRGGRWLNAVYQQSQAVTR